MAGRVTQAPCSRCHRPLTRPGCGFRHARSNPTRHDPIPRAVPTNHPHVPTVLMSRPAGNGWARHMARCRKGSSMQQILSTRPQAKVSGTPRAYPRPRAYPTHPRRAHQPHTHVPYFSSRRPPASWEWLGASQRPRTCTSHPSGCSLPSFRHTTIRSHAPRPPTTHTCLQFSCRRPVGNGWARPTGPFMQHIACPGCGFWHHIPGGFWHGCKPSAWR